MKAAARCFRINGLFDLLAKVPGAHRGGKKVLRRAAWVFLLAMVAATSVLLEEQPVTASVNGQTGDTFLAGVDPFVTGAGTRVNLSSMATLIQRGTLGTVGDIALMGVPSGAAPFGNSDFLIRRPNAASIPVGGSGIVVPIQFIDVNLASVNPVTTFLPGGTTQQWGLMITEAPVPLSVGSYNMFRSTSQGGFFGVDGTLFLRFTFTNVTNPNDTWFFDHTSGIHISGSGNWSTACTAGLQAPGVTTPNFCPGANPSTGQIFPVTVIDTANSPAALVWAFSRMPTPTGGSCTAGTYFNGTSCTPASPGHYVAVGGATGQTACSPGTYQPLAGQTSCASAAPGHYVSGTGATGETACNAGTFQSLAGQTSCTSASPGHYVSGTGATGETACEAGTYQSLSGQTFCASASPGHYVGGTGATGETACNAGTYQSLAGQTSCASAAPGHYVSGTGATGETACNAGTFQSLAGQTSCTSASPGHYVSGTGATGETACEAGTYQSLSGQTFCASASPGHYVGGTGATGETACDAGTYQSLAGQTSCTSADIGFYVDTTGAVTQTPCAAGQTTLAPGATSVLDCNDNKPLPSFTVIPNPAGCGHAVSFDATLSTHSLPGHSIIRHDWDFGDGGTASSTIPLATHAYAEFGDYDMILTVTDDNSPPWTATASDTVTVSLGNELPTADAGGPYTVDQGQDLALDGSGSSDPNADCGDLIIRYDWDLDNDGTFEYEGVAITVQAVDLAPRVGTTVPLRLRVTDSFGEEGEATTQVTVRSSPPEVNAGGPHTALEGDTVRLEASCFGCTNFAWDLDSDGVFEAPGAVVDFRADNGPFSYRPTVQGCDNFDRCTEDTVEVDTANVPVRWSDAPDSGSATVGEPFTVRLTIRDSGQFCDPCLSSEELVVVLDWGDGFIDTCDRFTVVCRVTVPPGSSDCFEGCEVEAPHVYTQERTADVTARVEDDQDSDEVGFPVVVASEGGPRSRITIIKEAEPNDQQDFEFDLDGDPVFLDDDDDATLASNHTRELPPGLYRVSEVGPPLGWVLTDSDCEDPEGETAPAVGDVPPPGGGAGGGVGDVSPGVAVAWEVDLDPGEHVICTFTNAIGGTIAVIKDAVPDSADDFEFSIQGQGVGPFGFLLDDDVDPALPSAVLFTTTPPTNHTDEVEVVETVLPPGWALVKIDCNVPATIDLPQRRATLTVESGMHASCVFTNVREADHYLGYLINKFKPKFVQRQVVLRDQFEEGAYQVVKPVRLYNPADKNSEGIIAEDTHYVGYKIEGPHLRRTGITVENQFGQLTLDTKKAVRLLVPAAKAVGGGGLTPIDPDERHYKCYSVKITRGLPRFDQRNVAAHDQFFVGTVTVGKPTHLCTPVEKRQPGQSGPGLPPSGSEVEDHLVCYRADTRPVARDGVRTLDQFGQLTMDVRNIRDLCVPSVKVSAGQVGETAAEDGEAEEEEE